jgi:hypothetical protein
MPLEGKGSSERCSVYADEGAKGGKGDEGKTSDNGKTIKLGWGSQNNGGLFLQVLACCSCAGLLFMMLFSHLPLALWLSASLATAAVSNAQTSLTLLYQNNLNGTDDENHIGFILLDPATKEEASGLCAAIGESLISSSEIKGHSADFVHSFTYLAYAGRALQVQQYSILDGVTTFTESNGEISFQPYPSGNPKLPVLCTQSSNQDQPGNAVATASNEVTISSTGNTYVGFRNQKSFRFLGIPYANSPKRFTYSTLYSPKGQTLNATVYAPECPQYGSGAESCLFLNIQTPYLPKQGSNADLRPVFFWIHGGGFVTGSALDPGVDGGNLASREDIVVVQIQYRLATLGFLAIPGTNIKGNFGIADQITALQV